LIWGSSSDSILLFIVVSGSFNISKVIPLSPNGKVPIVIGSPFTSTKPNIGSLNNSINSSWSCSNFIFCSPAFDSSISPVVLSSISPVNFWVVIPGFFKASFILLSNWAFIHAFKSVFSVIVLPFALV